MNILLFHQYFLEENDSGGSRWNEIAKSWTNDGHDVTVIAGMMHYNGDKKIEAYKRKYFYKRKQGKVTVMRTHVSESYNKGFLGRLLGYFSFMFSSLFAGLFKTSGKYDAVIVTSPPLFIGISGYLISRFNRAPMVFEVRDLWPESAIDTGVLTNKLMIRLAYKVEAFLYRKSALINVLTPAFLEKLIEKGVPKEKLIFIPNAADFTLAEKLDKNFNVVEFREKLGLKNNTVITYVGAHGVANHLEQILDAAERLSDTNVVFQLIGAGMKKKELVKKAKQRNITNVIFRDPVPKQEVFKYIMASDMGASVLKNVDTFKTVYSNKTFDYFSCRKPVLMAIDGVSRNLIEDARAGTYVEPENVNEYDRVIRDYIKEPGRFAIEGENGYHFAKKHFDRSVLADKYADYVNQLANSHVNASVKGVPIEKRNKKNR